MTPNDDSNDELLSRRSEPTRQVRIHKETQSTRIFIAPANLDHFERLEPFDCAQDRLRNAIERSERLERLDGLNDWNGLRYY